MNTCHQLYPEASSVHSGCFDVVDQLHGRYIHREDVEYVLFRRYHSNPPFLFYLNPALCFGNLYAAVIKYFINSQGRISICYVCVS